jgi:putative heme degradation protein
MPVVKSERDAAAQGVMSESELTSARVYLETCKEKGVSDYALSNEMNDVWLFSFS